MLDVWNDRLRLLAVRARRVSPVLACIAPLAAGFPQLGSAQEPGQGESAFGARVREAEPAEAAPPLAEIEPTSLREPGLGIQEVVVTVRKRAERLLDTPVSAVAVTRDALELRSITQLDDIGQAVAGLKLDTVQNSNSDGRFYIRGVGQDLVSTAVDPGVGLYVDGVYLPRLTGSILNLGDVERIEVLRGPQGTLYGKNTIGGVVNVITRKPGPEFGAEGFVRAGNFDRLDSNLSLNVPLSEKLFSRVSLSTRTQSGFVKSLPEGELGGDDKLLSGRFQLSWFASEDLEVNLAVESLRQNENLPLAQCRRSAQPTLTQQTFVVENTTRFPEACTRSAELFDDERSTSQDIPKQQQDIFSARNSVQWDLGGSRITSITGFRTVKTRTSEGDADNVNSNAVRFQRAYSQFDTLSQELFLNGDLLDGRLRWTAGVYGLREKGHTRSGVTVLPEVARDPENAELVGDPMLFLEGAPLAPEVLEALGGLATFGDLNRISAPLVSVFAQNTGIVDVDLLTLLRSASSRPINDYVNLSYAGFGELSFALTDKLKLTGGARYTAERRERQGKLIPQFSAPGPLEAAITGRRRTERFGRWTGRAILQYAWTDSLTSYVSFSRGFRSGGFNEPSAGAALTGRDPVGNAFDEEVLDSLEVGVKSRWFDNQLVLNLSGYYNEYDDIQLQTFADGAAGVPNLQGAVVQNAAKATVQGIELDFEAQPSFFEGLTLSGGLSLINARYDEFKTSRVRPIESECSRLRFSECPLDVGDVITPGLMPEDAVSPLGRALLQLTQPIIDRNVDVADLDFKQTPAVSFNVQARYVFDLGRIASADLGELDTTAQWYYQGETFQDTFNNDAAKQSKFGLLNGRLAWNAADGKTTVALWGRNLLDRTYVASSLDLRDLNGNNLVFLGEPRTYGLELRRRF